MKKLISFILAVTLLLSIPMSGVLADSPTKGGDIVLTTNQALNYLFYPQNGSGNIAAWGWPCMESLGYSDENNEWQLNLAERFDIDAENFVVTIKLHGGIRFHNGNELNADDLVWQMNYYLEHGFGSLLGSPVEIRKMDEYTIEVQYERFSLNYQTWLLTMWCYDREQYEEVGEDAIQTTMNGTGPYMFAGLKPDVSISYIRNENYWGEHDYGPDTITYLYMTEPSTMLATFIAGECANFESSEPAAIAQVEAYGYTAIDRPVLYEEQYHAIPVTNNPNDPLYNVKVRNAIYLYGVDWDAIAYMGFGDVGYHTDQIGYSQMPCYNPSIEVSGVDYEKAKELLAEAGFPDGFSTTIHVTAISPVATALQAELLKIGITANVQTVGIDAFTSNPVSSGIAVFSLTFNTLIDRVNKFYSPVGMLGKLTNWENPRYMELVNLANSTDSIAEQNIALAEYSKLMVVEEAVYWPICNKMEKWYFQPWYHFEGQYNRNLNGKNPLSIYVDPH